MEILKLKNGSEEAAPMVAVTIMTLKSMMDSGFDAIAVYELVMKCRDPSHVPFGNAGVKLEKAGLMESNGQIHDSIRNIVLSAFRGDGMEMTLGDPVLRE